MSKIISFILFLCAFAVYTSADNTEDAVTKDFMNIMTNCITENSVTEDDIKTLQEKKMPDSDKMKCLLACVYKKSGMMDEKGLLSPEGVRKLTDKYFPDNAEMRKKSDGFTEACKNVNDAAVKDEAKGCERAALIFKCSTEKGGDFDIV